MHYGLEIRIRDAEGTVINHCLETIYQIDLTHGLVEEVEAELSRLKAKWLPAIMQDVLEAEQRRYVQHMGEEWNRNGTTPITLKSLHGKIPFRLQRLEHKVAKEKQNNYF